MRPETLDLLRCPACGGALSLEGGAAAAQSLRCSACPGRYELRGGIPRLLEAAPLEAGNLRTQQSFGFEWLAYPGPIPEEDRRIFLEETQIPAEDWRGKTVLDAGCGMGRYTRVAVSLGAKVVAFDLSEALQRVAEAGIDAVQGNLLKPPLKKGSFDIIYSQGVIHHTPDAHAVFLRLAELLKPGGLLSVWVYGDPGSYAEFKQNPLRPGREWLRPWMPAAYAVVWTRHQFSEALRFFTTKLPIRAVYALCGPLAALGALPVLKYLTFSVHPDFQVRRIEDFDWLSPPYQSHHTRSELEGWCREAGLSPLKWLAHGLVPKPGVLARKG